MQQVFFSRGELLRSGVPIDHLRPGGRFTKVMRDVFVPSTMRVTFETRVDAALHRAPAHAIVAGPTAAVLWGGIVPNDETVHFNVPHDCNWRPRGLTVHRRHELSWVRHHGRPLTPPEMTFFELAETLQLVDLVVFGDSIVRGTLCRPDVLGEFAAHAQGRGAVRARKAAALVRTPVRSPMETRTRLLIGFAGLPEPEVNYEIWENGRLLYALDLAFPKWKVYVEYDGSYHQDSAEQRQNDHLRREWLVRHGWLPVTLVARDIYNNPGEVLRRVVETLVAAGARVSVRGVEWQRHFPVRR